MGTLLVSVTHVIPPITMLRLCLISALVAVALCQLGGWQEADANDLDATSLLEEVYYPESVGKEYLTLLKVETQVVKGVNYKYTFQIGGRVTCYAILHYEAWTDATDIIEDTCLM